MAIVRYYISKTVHLHLRIVLYRYTTGWTYLYGLTRSGGTADLQLPRARFIVSCFTAVVAVLPRFVSRVTTVVLQDS